MRAVRCRGLVFIARRHAEARKGKDSKMDSISVSGRERKAAVFIFGKRRRKEKKRGRCR
jgi:hypothetical protein